VNFLNYLILQIALGPGVHSASRIVSTRSKKIIFIGSRARPVREADNLVAICEPIV
jgi:hypothetical protein